MISGSMAGDTGLNYGEGDYRNLPRTQATNEVNEYDHMANIEI